MDNKPHALTSEQITEIAQMKEIREMWGAATVDDMQQILRTGAYATHFDFTSGGPGYCGDLFILTGDCLEEPVVITRSNGGLRITN